MTEPREFTNEDLTAYLDGMADAARVRDIDRALASDAALRARLQGLQVDPHAIASAFDALLPTAPAYPNASVIAPRRDRAGLANWRVLAATALIGAGLGWAVATFISHAKTETWQHYAATYHAMYVKGTLAHVTADSTTTADDLRRASAALGLVIAPSALSGVDWLEFKRAQVLGFGGRPVVQLAFLSKTGEPIALCIARTAPSRTQAIKTNTVLGMATATWAKGDHDYLLIGGTDTALIASSAAVFAKSL
jgi:hypothetical protein